MPEGEEQQGIENLFEKNNEGKLPDLVKETDFQEAQRAPKKLDPKRNTPRHIVIKLSKIKDKERILKEARGESYLQRSSHETISWFLKRNLAGKKGLERSVWSDKRQGPKSKITLSSKLSFRMEGQIKCFSDKVKLKKFTITNPLLYEMLKGVTSEKEDKKYEQ